MKKLLLLVALCLCTSVASAQTIEIVHLKNGGQTRGVIVELVPNKNLKVQASDGSVFVYSYDEIEKITRELSGQEPVPAYRNEMPAQRPAAYGYEMPAQRSASAYGSRQNNAYASSSRPHYEGGMDWGYSIGVGNGDGIGRVSFSTTHGCRVIPYLYVGAGVGVDYYHKPELFGIPIFADFRGYLLPRQNLNPFLNFRVGYSVADAEGLYFSPSVGINYKKLDVGFGYTYQEVGEVNIGAVTFKVGIRF